MASCQLPHGISQHSPLPRDQFMATNRKGGERRREERAGNLERLDPHSVSVGRGSPYQS